MGERTGFAPIGDLIEEIRNGRPVILVDDEDRENEGDLFVAAELMTPDLVNFMITHGRGLLCLAMTSERVRALDLPRQLRRNSSDLSSAFTVSIEARHGVTTGISASDRARTIHAAIDRASTPQDLRTPGHIFPLEARDGGVLVRAGHTEAAVDLARLAGLQPAGVICEILNEDGTMARRDALLALAERLDLRVGTIASLIAHRVRFDRVVHRTLETELDTVFGGRFRAICYRADYGFAEHMALISPRYDPARPALVRMHAYHVLNDMLFDRYAGKAGELQAAMRLVGEEGGILVHLFESLPTPTERLRLRADTGRAPDPDLREYGIGAQILRDLGVRRMVLLTNAPRTVAALDGFGLEIVGHRPIPSFACDPSQR